MRRLICLIFFIALISCPLNSMAATYFVSESAAGNGTGESYENRASVGTHNSGKGYFSNLKGNTVVLIGEFKSPIVVPCSGSSDSYITYDGKASAYNSLASDSKITGYNYSSSYSGIFINNKSFINLKNITVDFNYLEEMGVDLDNQYGIEIRSSNNIQIESSTITKVHNGVSISGDSFEIKLIKNLIDTIAESGLYIVGSASSGYPHDITIGGGPDDGNTIKNCTYKTKWDQNRVGYDVRLAPDVEKITISYNHLYSDKEYYGMSGILAHSSKNILIENNTIHDHQSLNHRAGISLKSEQPYQLVSNIIVRNNHIYNERSDTNSYAGASAATVISGNWKNIFIYGNYINNCGGGININYARWTNPSTHSDGILSHNMNVWSNIVSETSDYGIVIDGYSKGTDSISDVYILNNTLYRAANSSKLSNWAGFANRLSSTRIQNVNFVNNLIVDSRIETSERYSYYPADLTNISYLSNISYYTDEVDQTVIANNNPSFSDPANGNFSLTENSPMIDSADEVVGPTVMPSETTSLGGADIDYQLSINPTNTVWSTIPPQVEMVSQHSYGSGWEKGACVYDGTVNGALSQIQNVTVIKQK